MKASSLLAGCALAAFALQALLRPFGHHSGALRVHLA